MNMTASKNNYFWVNFKLSLLNKKMWLILIMLNVMAVPYVLVRYIFLDQMSSIGTIGIGVLATALIMVAGLVIPLNQFGYLFNKTKVDMAYSLPLTRKQKFFSDYLSGLTMYISTLFLQFVLSYVVSGIGLVVNDEFRKMFIYSFGILILKYFFIMLLILLFLYTLTTFTVSCCGETFEAVTSAIYVNVLLISTLYAGQTLLLSNLYGVDFEPIITRIMKIISPVGGGIVLIDNILNGNPMNLISWAIPYIIVIVIFLIMAYRNHVNRKAEDVSKPFVKKSFYYIIVTLLTFHITAFSFYTFRNYVNLVITSAFVFFIFEIITNRGFKKIGASIRRFAIIMAFILIVMISVEKTDCFKLVYRVSSTNNVKSITIDDPTVFQINNIYDFKAKLTKEESINKVRDFHKKILNMYKENGTPSRGSFETIANAITTEYYIGYNNGIKHMNLKYDVSLGIDYSRQYYTPIELLMDQLEIELLDEVIDQRFEHILEDEMIFSGIELYDKYQQKTKVIIPEYAIDTEQSKAFLKELMECMKEDLKGMSVEDYVAYDGQEILLGYGGQYTFVLTQRYENTMNFLKDKGYDLEDLYEVDDEFITNQNTWIEILEPDSNDSRYFYSAGLNSEYSYTNEDANYMTFEADEAMKTLLEVARKQYISDEPCYKLMVNNNEYIIPSEYSSIAKEVFDKYVK